MKAPCPFLPQIETPLGVADLTHLRGRHDEDAYLTRLRYAQSLWLAGTPAQALLQLNRAFTADLKGCEPVLDSWPLPYEAMGWIMRESPAGEFLGNPVRHFQHLATRMSGPRAELRIWRAWACFHLAEKVLGREGFPRDEEQIAKEDVVIPSRDEVLRGLREIGIAREHEIVARLW